MKAGFEEVVFIIKPEMEEIFKQRVLDPISKHMKTSYVFQEITQLPDGYSVPEGRVKPWGTCHAVMACGELLDGPFAVINADDYYGRDAFKKVYDFLTADEDENTYCMAGYYVENTLSEQGTVTRGVCKTDENHQLVDIQYVRSDMDFRRGSFRVRGDVLDIFPVVSGQNAVRVEFFGDEIDRITEFDTLTEETICRLEHVAVFPASHYVVDQEQMKRAAKAIQAEAKERVAWFKQNDKLLEAQRIAERTNYDVEMMMETGFCSGIENYSRHLTGLEPGQPPHTLLDYFPDDFLMIIDESHITVPQIRGMYAGDRSRKTTLVDYGFRLPSALDNRPLNFGEFEQKIDQLLFVSATPSDYEADHELLKAEQLIRPTGLLDPEIEVRPVYGQVDDLIAQVNKEIAKKNKVLVTTLTKRMAEDLTGYMREAGIRVKYLHSDIDTLERSEIIRDMRLDLFDVLVGINLLREGLDIPEIGLVAILDADKEGFLRSETSLIQTIGRAARNAEGHVIMYADVITDSMDRAIRETNRRRKIQKAYNEEHGITPETIKKAVRDLISISKADEGGKKKGAARLDKDPESMNAKELKAAIKQVMKKMNQAAAELDFEQAAMLRDQMLELKKMLLEMEA